MFDGLLKPKFDTKCKSCVKCIKSRLEMIRKKRNAVQKFLKNDIAELLRNGLDYNAYLRAEGLLIEQNMSSCYDLVVTFIGCISDNLKVLCKERDCPDECKEAVPSLIYAAARFADLPELRDLRTLFTEKFGNSLEPYLSKEFVEKFKLEPTKEMKIQILLGIAQEFSIEWDSNALEQRLNRSSPLHEKRPKHESLNDSDGRNPWRLQSSSDDETSTDISSQDGPKTCPSSLGSVSEDEVEYKMPSQGRIVPPPYLRAKHDDIHEPVVQEKPKPISVRRRGDKRPSAKADEDGTTSEKAKQSQRTKLADDSDLRDEEERILDGLLMHYSNKKSPYDTERNTKPIRTSLPSETSMEAKHVHPKLPDYDDLAARLAALK